MRRPEFIARQAAHPRGLVGRLLFRVMAVETLAVNERALELLELEPNSRVLEVGFGHGRTLAGALELAPNGLVAGINISADVVEAFRIRQRRSNDRVVIEVKQASSDQIRLPQCTLRPGIRRAHAVFLEQPARPSWGDPSCHEGGWQIRPRFHAQGRRACGCEVSENCLSLLFHRRDEEIVVGGWLP